MVRHNPAQILRINLHLARNPAVREVLAALLELIDIIPTATRVELKIHDTGRAMEVVEALFAHVEVVPELAVVGRFAAEGPGVFDEDAVLGVDVWGA